MTGSAPVLDRPALWAALSHMQITLPGSTPRFEEALADQQGWPRRFADRVTDEYRRFLYLAATAGSEVTPSQAVDQAWHLHLTLPHYRDELCGRILGQPLDHRPGTGEAEDEERYRRQYEETLASYERVFGKAPPRDVWPRPDLEGEEEERPWVKRRRAHRRLAFASLAGGIVSLPFASAAVTITLFAAALAFFLLSVPAKAMGGGGSAGCGGSCGGGSASSGDDCGGSCGGGSCGGGGCGGGD